MTNVPQRTSAGRLLSCCLNMLREIIPIIDFNGNYNLVPSRSIARFLLTVVTSVKLDDFRHFMRFSPGCLNIGSECLCLFFIVSFFLLWLGNSRISFRVSFFQATFTFCPSPIPDFHSPLFLGVLFLSSIISNQVGAHLISSIV